MFIHGCQHVTILLNIKKYQDIQIKRKTHIKHYFSLPWPLTFFTLFQEVMTLYFSHPAIEGIILWGYWDGRIWKPEMPLYEGPDVTVTMNEHKIKLESSV